MVGAYLVVYDPIPRESFPVTCLLFRDERDFREMEPDSRGYNHARRFTLGTYEQSEYFRKYGIEITEILEEVPDDMMSGVRKFFTIDAERIRPANAEEAAIVRSAL